MADNKSTAPAEVSTVPKPARGHTSNPVESTLAGDFPARRELSAAGYTDAALLAGLPEDELSQIEGIGPQRAKEIRKALGTAVSEEVEVEVIRPSGFPYGGGNHAFGTRLRVPGETAEYHDGTFLRRVRSGS